MPKSRIWSAKQEKKQTKKDQKVQQADTGAPTSPPEAEVAESPFTVTSLSSHLSAHMLRVEVLAQGCHTEGYLSKVSWGSE